MAINEQNNHNGGEQNVNSVNEETISTEENNEIHVEEVEDDYEIDIKATDFRKKENTGQQQESSSTDKASDEEEEVIEPEVIGEDGKKKEEKLGIEDYRDIAEFGIEIIDLAFSQSFKFLAQEKNATEFELSESKKSKLSGMLAKIMLKHNFKMTIEVMFFFVLITAYFPLAKKAWNMRQKKNKKAETYEYSEEDDDDNDDDNNTERRGPGRPRKKQS